MNVRRASIFAALMLGLGAAATGCATKAYSSQCAFVIGDGVNDNRQVKQIIYPGTGVDVGDDIVRFVPCNARNFIIADRPENRDRTMPVGAKTKAGEGQPATRVKVFLSAYFTLNQQEKVLKDFVPFCEKYNCYSEDDDVSGSDNYSSPGWNGMLAENFSPAIDRSTIEAMTGFDPSIYQDSADWPKLADAISSHFAAEIKKSTGSQYDYFCASGSDTRQGECGPVRFTIDRVEPSDARILGLEDDQAKAQQERIVNQERLRAAKELYGPLANYYLGLLDTIAACKAAGQNTCIVTLGGNAPTVSLPAK